MKMVMNSIEKIIQNEIFVAAEKATITCDEDLIDQGIVDSLGLMKLISGLEREFGINIHDEDLIPDNFRSINAIAQFVMTQNGV